ncbi:uncharacterized protein LOC129596944 [Paramacrobiotus metropolitanus]|uniref:uncharacterized protein LOC129596944 n=1 Tax=Paramacrobiotus metropolitanus TaxID=2943436 RepID=UPI00244565EB|nr:uncharacterized protein LOC129596944 [Paramacrobiotus metropolitanus]
MRPSSNIFVVFVAVTGALAAMASGECTIAHVRGIAECTFPLVQWSFSINHGQPLADVALITDSQLASLCQIARGVVRCVKETSQPCTEGAMASLHEAMTTGAPLLENACARPDFGNNVRTLLRCVKKLNQTAGTKTLPCAYKAANRIMTNMENDDVSKGFCCNAKEYEVCSGSELADNCDQEAEEIFGNIRDKLFKAFQCNGPRGANCQAWTPGLPSGRLDWDVTSLLIDEETRALMTKKGF